MIFFMSRTCVASLLIARWTCMDGSMANSTEVWFGG